MTELTTTFYQEPTRPVEVGCGACCKDVEYYMWATMQSNFRHDNMASALVYYDQAGPLLYQKTGWFHITSHLDSPSRSD